MYYSIDTIQKILADSGGDKSVAASRLIQWSARTCKLHVQVYYLHVQMVWSIYEIIHICTAVENESEE